MFSKVYNSANALCLILQFILTHSSLGTIFFVALELGVCGRLRLLTVATLLLVRILITLDRQRTLAFLILCQLMGLLLVTFHRESVAWHTNNHYVCRSTTSIETFKVFVY